MAADPLRSLHALQRSRSHRRRTHFMNVSRRQFALASLTLAASAQFASARTPKKLKVLVVDGMNNHTWKVATAAIREILTDTDLFTVDVSTTPPADADTNAWDSWRPDFFRYDVVVNNFNSGYDAKAILWPQPVRQALEKYVSRGGGLVSYHAANNAFLFGRSTTR
jgi:uncharacterized protein